MSEIEIRQWIVKLVRRRFTKSRLSTRYDYWSPQWKALGCINYWLFRGRVYAVVEMVSRMGCVWPRGVSEKFMTSFEETVRRVGG